MLVVFHVDEEGVISRDRCYRAIYFQADKQHPGGGRKVRRDFWASSVREAQAQAQEYVDKNHGTMKLLSVHEKTPKGGC